MLVLCPFALLPVLYLGFRHGLFHGETGHSIGGFLGFTSPQIEDFKISLRMKSDIGTNFLKD